MRFRISPVLWPVLLLCSPFLAPWLVVKNLKFRKGRRRAAELNRERIDSARKLDIPVLKKMELVVLVEYAHEDGFLFDDGVSYLIRTDQGAVLMDLGFGPGRPTFSHNASKLGLTAVDSIDNIFITHLHSDHMGGMEAFKNRTVFVPAGGFPDTSGKPCYVPEECAGQGLDMRTITAPEVLEAGIASTGPLARMLFFFGMTEEQALIARLENKGLVVLTGCGHPTIEVILKMVRRISDEQIYAIGGGLHFPLTASRVVRAGIHLQQVAGTGKPVWRRITDADLTRTIAVINEVNPRRLLLSAHDTCDYAIERFANEVDAQVEVLKAGATYHL